MKLGRVRDRVRALEQQTTRPDVDWDVERRERTHIIECCTTDPETMDLYHQFLETVSQARCPHRSMSACWPCVQRNEVVNEAHARFQQRMKEMESRRPTIHPTEQGGST